MLLFQTAKWPELDDDDAGHDGDDGLPPLPPFGNDECPSRPGGGQGKALALTFRVRSACNAQMKLENTRWQREKKIWAVGRMAKWKIVKQKLKREQFERPSHRSAAHRIDTRHAALPFQNHFYAFMVYAAQSGHMNPVSPPALPRDNCWVELLQQFIAASTHAKWILAKLVGSSSTGGRDRDRGQQSQQRQRNYLILVSAYRQYLYLYFVFVFVPVPVPVLVFVFDAVAAKNSKYHFQFDTR